MGNSKIKKILCVVGTRPEAIKMAPIILALRNEEWANVKVLATAQHRQMLDQVLDIFGIIPDIDLNIMKPNQELAELTSALILSLGTVLKKENPDFVLAQGDTTTVMTTALAAFYQKIPFGHVEAGLRTWDLMNPFPEELNRVIAGKLAAVHFAPTQVSRSNLNKEGVVDEKIIVTGNTVIDALLMIARQETDTGVELSKNKRMILVTAHRRENFGKPLRSICHAIREIAVKNTNIEIVFAVHPNPNVSLVVNEILTNIPNVHLIPPVEYGGFVALLKKAYIVLTDSGGIQEEAPALGKPVLVMRDDTERPEAVAAGVAKLVGTQKESIIREVQKLLDDPQIYRSMAQGISPYGDGKASHKIVQALKQFFN